MTKAAGPVLNTLADVISGVRERTNLFGDERSPLYGRLHFDYRPDSKMCLVLGDNGSGKSLLRRCIQLISRDSGVKCMHLSMEKRCTAGVERAFIYGGEDEDSTGSNSASTVHSSITSSKQWTDPHVIFYDEPDIGLSDDGAAGAAIAIREYLGNPNPALIGAFVVTHRKVMVDFLCERRSPSFAFLGAEPPASIADWRNRPILPILPEDLHGKSIDTWRRVNAFFKLIRSEKERKD